MTLDSKIGRKNINAKIIKIAVLITGTKKLESNKAPALVFFFNKLKIKPATIPATVHFNKHASTVPTGLIGMNIAKVDGENKAIIPLKKPTIAPEIGPHIAAAKTMVTSDKLILTGPNCK